MTILDIAQEMKGKLRDGYDASQAGGAARTSTMSYGTATADSVNGFVTIIMDNAVADGSAYDPADYEFTVACDSPISNGDRVAYIVIDGVGKAISLGGLTDMATTADTNAANAIAIANATGQYFFHDGNGAHVSTVANNPNSGRNVILNTQGLLFRDGTTNLAYFTPTSIALGMNCTINSTVGSEGTVALSLYNLVNLKLKRILFMPWYTGSTPPVGNTKSATVIDSAFVADEIQTGGHIDGNTALFNKLRSSEYYDGDGVLMDTTRGASAFLTNTAAASTTTSLAKVTLGSTIVRSDSNLFAKSSNGIQCKKAGTVLVSGEVYCQNLGTTNNLAVDIYKGTASQFEVVQSCGMTGFATAAITPRALTVAANDVISLYVKSTTAATSGIPVGGACLTVTYM